MGDRCHFAHGEEDLRKISDVNFQDLTQIKASAFEYADCFQLKAHPDAPIGIPKPQDGDELQNSVMQILASK